MNTSQKSENRQKRNTRASSPHNMQITVKWNGQLFNEIEVNSAGGTGIQLKENVYRATGVEPERQKIIIKGIILKDETDLSTLSLSEGCTVIMMGTPQNKFTPVEKTNLSAKSSSSTGIEGEEQQKEKKNLPIGLQKLGNTCYFNSVIQCIFNLKLNMEEYFEPTAGLLSQEIHALYSEACKAKKSEGDKEETEGLEPSSCLRALRSLNSQFSQISPVRVTPTSFIGVFPAQQDAEECLSFILNQIPSLKELFRMEIEEKSVNENDPEDVQVRTDELFKVHCMISATTNNLSQGIKDFLHTKLIKQSPKTNQEAEFNSTIQITKSPQFLLVQMGRFSFRQDSQMGTKVLKKVSFPPNMNIREFCSEQNNDCDFRLKALITHKGRALASGHYIAWCLNEHDKWVKYDDDKVDFVTEDEIMSLAGGGDWHMNYLLFYEKTISQ